MARLVARAALVASLTFVASAARAGDDEPEGPLPGEVPRGARAHGNTSVGVLAGIRWLYDPGLADYARANGDRLTSIAPAGFSVLAPFAYWTSPSLQYSLDLGY